MIAAGRTKISHNGPGFLRQGKIAVRLTLDQIGHIIGENLQSAYPFLVCVDILWGKTVNLIPIAGRNDGHLADGKVFVQLIESRAGAAATAADDTRAKRKACRLTL